MEIGRIRDLEETRRMILDPHGEGSHAIVADVLWSDPARRNGCSYNATRGIGLVFGPDCTQKFLEDNHLKVRTKCMPGS